MPLNQFGLLTLHLVQDDDNWLVFIAIIIISFPIIFRSYYYWHFVIITIALESIFVGANNTATIIKQREKRYNMVDPLKVFWVLTNSSYLGM